MNHYETRVTRLTVAPIGRPIFDEQATRVEIANEAAGEFVEVTQEGRENGTISIEPGEWPALRAAIDQLIGDCRDE